MVFPIPNYTRIKVRGHFVDLAKAAREETSYGLTGPVQFIPTPIVAINQGSQQIIEMKPFVTFPRASDGYFEIMLPSTDDPDVVPQEWNYKVIEPTGRTYYIVVPYDTPNLVDTSDPDYGTQVIDLVDVVPDPEDRAGTIQLLHGRPGRDITSVDIDDNSHLVGTYSDNTTWDAGLLPVASVAGKTGVITLVKADVGLGNADNTSDANKPISTATQTALNGKQPLDTDLTAIAGLAPADNDIIQRKTGAWINRTPAQLKTDLALVKADVGLSNVDNTSDANKPVSTATQTALNGKANSTHTHAQADVTGLDTALAGKANATHTHPIADIAATGTPNDTVFLRGDGTWASPPNAGGGVTDHGALTGLADDDHTQYHNDTRGDARYYTKSQVDTSLSGKADSSALTSHTNSPNPHYKATTATLNGTAATVDTNTYNAINITLNGTGTLNVPTGGSDGATLQVIAYAAAQQTFNFHASLARLDGITASYTVPAGKKLRALIRRSTVGTDVWIVEAVGTTQ